MHRDLGHVSFRDGAWWLTNLGSRIVLRVATPGGDLTGLSAGDPAILLPVGRSMVDFDAVGDHYRVAVEVTRQAVPTGLQPAPQTTTVAPDVTS